MSAASLPTARQLSQRFQSFPDASGWGMRPLSFCPLVVPNWQDIAREWRAAFYNRVSTDTNQDPVASRATQFQTAQRDLNKRAPEVQICFEYSDIDISRSLTWKQRPAARQLLLDLTRADRPFDVLVVSEHTRAFHGAQWQFIAPILENAGIRLWMPEMPAGWVDFRNPTTDIQMSILGSMSKGERDTGVTRVRNAHHQAASTGTQQGGRPPFGYIAENVSLHPNRGKARLGVHVKRFTLNPDERIVDAVRQMFQRYANGHSIGEIITWLTATGIPCPSQLDPERNPGRDGNTWQYATVRAILSNERYTGTYVYGLVTKVASLQDPLQPDEGVRVRRLPGADHSSNGITTTPDALPAIITRELYDTVASRLAETKERNRKAQGLHQGKQPRTSQRDYLLRGLITCAPCERRMTGAWNNYRNCYRCVLRDTPEHRRRDGHRATAYLREDHVVAALDQWLTRLAEPSQRVSITDALSTAAAQEPPASALRRKTLQAAIKEHDEIINGIGRIAAAGGDPATLAAQLNERIQQRDRDRAELEALRAPQALADADLTRMLNQLRDLPAILDRADPTERHHLYEALAVRILHDPISGETHITTGHHPQLSTSLARAS